MITVLRRTAVISACVLLSGLSVPLAHAAGNPTPDPDPGSSTTYDILSSEFALTVSPARIVVAPADIGKVSEVLVVNRGQVAVPVTAQEKDFTAGSDGALNYQDAAPYGAASWITVSPESFVVQPGKAQVVTTTITVPPSPELGDHQAALVFLVEAGKTDGNIKVNRGVGVPAFITVPGPTDNSVSLGALTAPGFALGGPALWSVGGPVDVSTTVRNAGTVHRDFRDKEPLQIENGGASTSFPDFTVMRGATRDVSAAWEPPLMCICHPTVAVTAADGTIQQVATRVVVFPLQWLAIILAAGLGIFFAVRWRRRRYQAAVHSAAARINGPDSGGNA